MIFFESFVPFRRLNHYANTTPAEDCRGLVVRRRNPRRRGPDGDGDVDVQQRPAEADRHRAIGQFTRPGPYRRADELTKYFAPQLATPRPADKLSQSRRAVIPVQRDRPDA